jgi:hypothetical protein
LVLTITNWPRIRQATDPIQAKTALIETGGYEEMLIPRTITAAAVSAATTGE